MDTWISPKNGKPYPIQKDGKTSPTLMRLIRTGQDGLIKGSAFVFNASTGRLVKKSTFYTNKNTMRAAMVTKGYVAEENPNVVYIPNNKDLENLHRQRGNEFADSKYFSKAKKLNLKKKTDQQRINEDPELVNQKVVDMKAAGRMELDGSPEQIAQALANYMDGTKKSGAQKLKQALSIAYVTKDGLYRCGGFIRHIDPEKLYVAIGTDKGLSFSCNLKNCKAIYIKPLDNRKKKVEEVVVEEDEGERDE
jgi:hypothetical protein